MKFEIPVALLFTLCSFSVSLYSPNMSSPSFVPLYLVMQGSDVTCVQPPDPGMCRAAMQKYFYNSTSGACDVFLYGGCGGNMNKFDSVKDCMQKCQGYNNTGYNTNGITNGYNINGNNTNGNANDNTNGNTNGYNTNGKINRYNTNAYMM